MATIEGADADGEGKIKRLLAGQQHQFLGADLAEAHPTGSDLRCGMPSRLGDCLGGAVDREDMAGPEQRSDGARRGSRSAADLEHAHPWADRQRVYDPSQTRRERAHVG